MPGQMALTLINGASNLRPQRRMVAGPEFKLGRGESDGPKIDWVLPDSSRTISRLHCVLFHDQDDWFVTDVSRNGTFLNHEPGRLPPQAPRRLRNGDRLRIGPYEFQVQLASEAGERPGGDEKPNDFNRNIQRSLSPDPPPRTGAVAAPENGPQWDEPWPDLPADGGKEAGPKPQSIVPESIVPGNIAKDDALLAAALEGARLGHLPVRDAADTMRRLGQEFRAMVSGLRMAQAACRAVRSGLRINEPQRPGNPLRTDGSDADVMAALLGLAAEAPPAEAFRAIGDHEIATMAAMRTAVGALLASLSPDTLRRKADQAGGLSVLSTQRKARAWDEFETRYAQVCHGLEDDFDRVFGRAFAEAYERTFVVRRQEDEPP